MTEECDCEFERGPLDEEDIDEEPWHYRRECPECGYVWYGLHCRHELIQRPCYECGVTPLPVGEA